MGRPAVNHTLSSSLQLDVNVPNPDTPKWELSDRLAWALGLKVSPHAKLIAVAIASHTGASSGLCWPGMALLVEETGLSRSSVIRGVRELERGGHLTVTRLKVGRKNASNRYRLPAMGSGAVTLPSVCVTPPPSVCVTPEPVKNLEPVKNKALRAREVCPVCQYSWPAEYGTDRQRRQPVRSQPSRSADREADGRTADRPVKATVASDRRGQDLLQGVSGDCRSTSRDRVRSFASATH